MSVRSTSTGDEAPPVRRRAPFASNPSVGSRGQQARERILEASLELFGEVGYHECAVQRITERSGCSRASFYQYFSSKEDLFRELAGRVARELRASNEALEPVGPDAAGVRALREWFDRYSEVYERYRAMFLTFQSAADSDEMVQVGSERVRGRTFSGIRSKLEGSTLADDELDDLTHLLYETALRANRTGELVEPAWPDLVGVRRARLNAALAEVFHRVLHGVDPEVNVTPPPKRRARRPVSKDAAPTAAAEPTPATDDDLGLGPTAQRTRQVLLDAAHVVFARLGFYAARVDDIVEEAEVSHGIFYRYFDSKAEIFQILAERAASRLSGALVGIVDEVTTDDLDGSLVRWLSGYAESYSEEASFVTTWVDKVARRRRLASDPAFALDDLQRAMATFIGRDAVGDPEVEAVVLLVLLDVLTTVRPAPTPEVLAWVIERSLLQEPARLRPTG